MQQYFTNKELNKILKIDDDLYHYLKNVIKIRLKEKIILFNNMQKAIYIIESFDSNSKSIIASLVEKLEIKNNNYVLDIAFGLLKKDKTEFVIEKTVELGVDNIILLNLTNNVVKFKDNMVEKKIGRYKEKIISACEQCKRDRLANIYYLDDKKVINFKKYDYVFFLYEKENENDFSQYLFNIKSILNKRILIIIGPEGGYTKEEIEYFKSYSESVSINDNILRAETAAVVGVGLVKSILK